MKRYRCIKDFVLPVYDDDGFVTDEFNTIKSGEVYTLDESGSTIIGGEVHLDGEEGWIEIPRDKLDGLFEEINDICHCCFGAANNDCPYCNRRR